MCIPAGHGDAAVISYLDLFAATPVQPLPPTRPPHQRHLTLRQQRPIPSLTLAVVPESSEDNATTVAATPKRAQRTLRCTCHNTPVAMRLGEKRHVTATDDVTLSIRLFITLSIAILASKLIADVVYSTGVDGTLVGNRHSYRTKRQLPPIEQGNMVIDRIFQIPINTLSAVGTLIKYARPLVRRTRERIQQYYTAYQQQYGNGQQQYINNLQQYINDQQQYGNNLLQYFNSQQYYTTGQKRYSIGRQNSNTDQDDEEEEFVDRPKQTQIPINTLSPVGTLIKTTRPLVRRTRERIQQYYTGYQQQYGNDQQQYGNNLQKYFNSQQYYTTGQKRYSIGRQNSNTDQDGGEEEFVHRPKQTQVIYRPEDRLLRSRYKSEVY